MEYYEGNKKMIVDLDFRDPVQHLSLGLIDNWEKPYDSEIIEDNEKRRIIRNIEKYFIKRGFRYVIEDGETEML